jgi:acetolactate synthase-1/2/3 large subunit
MTGAEHIMKTLAQSGVKVCFANPGTSEMHLVGALENVPGMRPVLCLFEGVTTAAADGYARMTGQPACTMLHLGPGFANSAANSHNARRGFSPMINIIGEHATFHVANNAPLTTDIATAAEPFSDAVKYISSTASLASDLHEALATANEGLGKVVTLVVPSDIAWSETEEEPATHIEVKPSFDSSHVSKIADALREDKTAAILLGGVISESSMLSAAKIAKKTGARFLLDIHMSRTSRGAGTPVFERLQYFPELAIDQLADVETMVCAGIDSPVGFFGYPNTPSSVVSDRCDVHSLALPGNDIEPALKALESKLDAANESPELYELKRPEPPSGALTREAVAQSVMNLFPENAIVVDESITSGGPLNQFGATGPKHDILRLTGGAIGWGLPASIGAAIACPDRKVFAFEGDGSAMYTIQALWTMARENLDITAVIFANRDYSILQMEYARMGFDPSHPNIRPLMNLEQPSIRFADLGTSMGVKSVSTETAEDFHQAFQDAVNNPGPNLIEVVLSKE